MEWLRVGSDEKFGSFYHVIMFSKMVFISSLHESQLIGLSAQDGHVSRSTHSCYCSYFPENFRIRQMKLFVPFVFFVFKSYSLISSFNFCYPLMFVRRWRTSTKLSSLPLDPFKFCNLNIFPYFRSLSRIVSWIDFASCYSLEPGLTTSELGCLSKEPALSVVKKNA